MNSVRVSTGELSLTEFYSAANGDDLVIQVLDLPSKLVGKFMFTPNSQSSQPHGSIVMVYFLKFKQRFGCFRNGRDDVNQPTTYCYQRKAHGIIRTAHATTVHKYLTKRAPRSRRSRLPARCTAP
jgi:hypothetical protein